MHAPPPPPPLSKGTCPATTPTQQSTAWWQCAECNGNNSLLWPEMLTANQNRATYRGWRGGAGGGDGVGSMMELAVQLPGVQVIYKLLQQPRLSVRQGKQLCKSATSPSGTDHQRQWPLLGDSLGCNGILMPWGCAVGGTALHRHINLLLFLPLSQV